MSRFARRTDANHSEIKEALKGIGVQVIDTHAAPEFVDLVTVFRGHISLIEVKDGDKSPSRRKLTPAQIALHAKVRAGGGTIHIVETVDQALAVFGARRAA